jgi:hypothetical protein
MLTVCCEEYPRCKESTTRRKEDMHFRSRAAAVRFAPGLSILFGVGLRVVGMSTTVPLFAAHAESGLRRRINSAQTVGCHFGAKILLPTVELPTEPS